MVTRLHINGRVYTSGQRHPYAGPVHTQEPEVRDDHWAAAPKPPKDFVDGPHGLRYRIIDNVGADWITLPDLLRISKQPVQWVVNQVIDGKLDAAMARGSTIPLLRVREPKILAAVAQQVPPPPVTKLKDNKKGAWHKS